MQKNRQRLDELLWERGLCDSRSQAKGLILAGKVRRGSEVLDKPGKTYPADTELTVVRAPRYVGRGGEKLEAYLKTYPTCLSGKRSLDIGASTGGFTDCLLQNGIAEAVCVDVGRGQLHYKLLQDTRVTNLEKVNARYLSPDQLPQADYPIIVMDLSFISLKQVLPAVWPLLKAEGKLIALVKPQFEASKKDVDQGRGVIRDASLRKAILEDMIAWSLRALDGSELEGSIQSPIKGGDGNQEFLIGLTKSKRTS